MNTFSVLSGLLGGLAFFLYGMDRLTASLNSVAGSRLQSVLSAATRNVFYGALTGAVLTALLQSSSLTTVLCVGFISAGLLTLRQAVGVIVGANVGTTFTAQVIALDVAVIALPLIAVGVLLRYMVRSDWQKHVATVLFGIGLIFYGMELMTVATEPLRSYPPFIEVMKSLDHAWLGILAGVAFTALVQSSSATTGLVLVLGSQGFLSLQAAIAVVLGANIGSCVTALVAAYSRGVVARQAAAVHVIFNVAGASFWWLLLDPLARLTRYVSGDDIARQIANAHTIFNLSSALVFLGLSGGLAKAVERLIPDEPTSPDERPLHLDPAYLTVPSLALERVRQELCRLGATAVNAVSSLEDHGKARKAITGLTKVQEAIVDYARQISREQMNEEDSHDFKTVLVVADSLEAVGVAVNELLVCEKQLGSSPFLPEVEQLHILVTDCLRQAVESIADPIQAPKVREHKERVRSYRDEAMRIAISRLDTERPGAAQRYRYRAGVVDELRRIYYLASHISRAVEKHQEKVGAITGAVQETKE